MNIHYWNEFQFEVGRFKQPISYEQLIQDRYVPTLERSLIDQLVPQRDLGAMIHGEEVCNNLFDYAVSLSNGEINGNSTDLNDHKDLDGRFAIRPLNWLEDEEWLRWFQVGFSGGFGIEQEPINPATLRTPDTVPYFSFNSTVRADGLRTRLCPELAYFYGPVGFFAEYYDEHQDMTPTATGKGSGLVEDVPFRGYVCTGTCFLTGETGLDLQPTDLSPPQFRSAASDLISGGMGAGRPRLPFGHRRHCLLEGRRSTREPRYNRECRHGIYAGLQLVFQRIFPDAVQLRARHVQSLGAAGDQRRRQRTSQPEQLVHPVPDHLLAAESSAPQRGVTLSAFIRSALGLQNIRSARGRGTSDSRRRSRSPPAPRHKAACIAI